MIRRKRKWPRGAAWVKLNCNPECTVCVFELVDVPYRKPVYRDWPEYWAVKLIGANSLEWPYVEPVDHVIPLTALAREMLRVRE